MGAVYLRRNISYLTGLMTPIFELQMLKEVISLPVKGFLIFDQVKNCLKTSQILLFIYINAASTCVVILGGGLTGVICARGILHVEYL